MRDPDKGLGFRVLLFQGFGFSFWGGGGLALWGSGVFKRPSLEFRDI